MSPRIVLTAAAILAVAAIAFVFTVKSGNESQSDREIPDSVASGSVNQDATARVVPAEQPETREGPDAAREAAPSVAWAGKITDEAGQPLPAAELSWGALLPRFTGADVQVYSDHGQALAEHLVLATTDSEGRFRMERAPEGLEQHGSVLWITSSGFEAQAVILAAGEATRPGAISLRKQEGVRVRVRNLSSEPVADAQVQQFLNSGGGSAASMLEPGRAARRLYMRSARTGPEGECVLPMVTGMFQVYARKEALQSAPCFQEGAAAIQLILAPCCRVEGRVVLPCSGLPREGAYLALYGLAKSGNTEGMTTLTGRIMFREDGSFGPLSVPVLAGMTAMRLRGAGGPLLETYLDRPMPAPGDSVYLTMELLLGEKLGVEVVDEGGKPVESAQVQVSVNPTWNTFVNGSFARTDGKGGTQLAVPGTQAFFISAWSEGLAPATVGPMLHSPGMSPVRIELLPAGGLRVRLFRHGEAVTKYRLNLWQGDPRKGWQEACENPEGLLTLADLAPGSYSVQASAEEWPQTRPQTLTIKAGEIADCELMIPEPVPARGRVVDALTGEPLPQARVMLHNSVGSSLSWPRDIEIPLDAQGGFALPQVGEAGGAIMVSAEGYAVAVENYRWDPAQGEMARVIALQKKSPVVVEVSHRGGEPLKGYHVSSPVGMSLTPLPLPANGRLELPAQSPSSAMVSLHMPDGSTMSQWIAIASQPLNIVRFTVGGTASLEARLGTGEAARRLVGGEAVLRSLERTGEVARSMRITRGDAILMQGLEPGEYTLELRNASDAIAASMPVRLREGQRERVDIALNASDIELSIVDRDGLPLSGVKAEVVGQEPGAKWFLRGITDVRGRILLGGVTPGRALLALDHEELGMRRGLDVELRAGVNEVRFEPGERLEVLLTENGEPRPGVVVLFEHPGHSAQARSKYSSDERGMIRTQRCNDGNYRIIVRHLGYWQEERDVSIPSKGQTVLALRPMGDVRLVALDRYGKEQGGVEIELSCTGMNAKLETWISAGRVAAPPGGLRTGENGELLLRGLPAAEYRFRARSTSGESAEGTFQLLGRSEARVELPLR